MSTKSSSPRATSGSPQEPPTGPPPGPGPDPSWIFWPSPGNFFLASSGVCPSLHNFYPPTQGPGISRKINRALQMIAQYQPKIPQLRKKPRISTTSEKWTIWCLFTPHKTKPPYLHLHIARDYYHTKFTKYHSRSHHSSTRLYTKSYQTFSTVNMKTKRTIFFYAQSPSQNIMQNLTHKP